MTTDTSMAAGAMPAPTHATAAVPKRGKPQAAQELPSFAPAAETTGKASEPSRSKAATVPSDSPAAPPPPPSKLDRLAALLADPAGATIAAMTAATGWQAHSVRGALAGALRKRGLVVVSTKVDGVRTYRAAPAA